jgi:hypothetical protein
MFVWIGLREFVWIGLLEFVSFASKRKGESESVY